MTTAHTLINLGALASVVERLRDTYTWLADIDYPGVGEAMASCEAGINTINDLIDLACRTYTPSEQRETVMAIIDAWMEGYDFVGTGSIASANVERKEWEKDRARILSALGQGEPK